MTSFVTSADGTRIAFEILGDGPPVVLVGGMFCHRPQTRALAEALAATCTVLHADRRGRGESGDAAAYAVEREVEDVAALLDVLGGGAALYGHSSGAGLALEAAAAGLPVDRLVLHEPPYSGDDDASRAASREFAAQVGRALDEGRPDEAIRMFLAPMGVPPEDLQRLVSDPGMIAVAPTMRYDLTVMGDATTGGGVPVERVRAVTAPTLVLLGTASGPMFESAARRVLAELPAGRLEVLDGHDHGAPAEVVAPVVAAFVTG